MARLKLDDAKKREILAILTVGGKRVTAADYVGCSVRTISRTAERDPHFADALRQAKSRHEIVNLQNIQDAGKKSWRASSWLLERSFPNRYGKRPPRTLSADDLGYVVAQFAKIVTAEVTDAKERRRIRARLAGLAERLHRGQKPESAASSEPKTEQSS